MRYTYTKTTVTGVLGARDNSGSLIPAHHK